MNQTTEGIVEIKVESDIVAVRQAVREVSTALGFGATDTTRIVTAASELARNVFKYAGGGQMTWREVHRSSGHGIELRFEDKGPGIENIDQALTEGYTTGGGLGMGLPGAKKLMDELELVSKPGEGTTVTVKKWQRG